MQKSKILKIIKAGEGLTAEFKTSISGIDRLVEIMASFANTKGGSIVIGIKDDGKILGIDIGRQTIEHIANKITDNTDPVIYPKIDSVKIDNKNLLIISAEESIDKPHTAFGKPYIRISKVTKPMKRSEYNKQLKAGHKGFENEICSGTTIKDIDFNKLRWYLRKKSEKRQIEMPKAVPKKILRNVGAIIERKGKLVPTNLGILFFGKTPQKFISQSEVKLARFKGTNMVDFIDRIELNLALPDLIDEAEKFVKRNTRKATKIVEFEQVNIAEYPYEAIREAITNAVTHRDYAFGGANVRVMVFDDRIEVESPGKLPEGVTLKNLEGSHVLRNKKIAGLLYDVGYIEKWGTGIRRMKDAMKGHGLPFPKFEERDTFFKLTFYGPGEDILGLVKPKERIDLKEMGLNKRQIEALRLLVNEKQKINNKKYRFLFNVSNFTAYKDINLLLEKGLAKQIGKGRAAYYVAHT